MFNFKPTINATTTKVQKFKHDYFSAINIIFPKNLNLLDNNLTFIH